MTHKMFDLLKKQKNYDVTFTFLEEETYKVHSTVLCGHGDLFSAAFFDVNPLSSFLPGSVHEVVDAPIELFRDLIRFTYVGVISDEYCKQGGFKSLVALYKVVQRYEHSNLLCHCFIRIKAQLSV